MIQIVTPLTPQSLASEPLRTLFKARQELYPTPRTRRSYTVIDDSPSPRSPSPPAVANSPSPDPGLLGDRAYQHYTLDGYRNIPPLPRASTPDADENDNFSMVSTMDLQYPGDEEDDEANVIDVSVPVLLCVYFDVGFFLLSRVRQISELRVSRTTFLLLKLLCSPGRALAHDPQLASARSCFLISSRCLKHVDFRSKPAGSASLTTRATGSGLGGTLLVFQFGALTG